MRSAIRTMLANDATLMATLTGGLYAAQEITRQDAAAAFDTNLEIKPCGLVTVSTETSVQPYEDGSYQYIQIYFYQRSGYDQIDIALKRVYALLNRQKVTSGTGVWEVRHGSDSGDGYDNALRCSVRMSTYQVVRRRV